MKLTDGLKGYVSERCTEVVVEEAFQDVQRDVGEACVNVDVDGQNHSISTDDTARDYVSLMSQKQEKHHRNTGKLFKTNHNS